MNFIEAVKINKDVIRENQTHRFLTQGPTGSIYWRYINDRGEPTSKVSYPRYEDIIADDYVEFERMKVDENT